MYSAILVNLPTCRAGAARLEHRVNESAFKFTAWAAAGTVGLLGCGTFWLGGARLANGTEIIKQWRWRGRGGGRRMPAGRVEAAVGVAVRVFKVCSQDTGSAAFGGADHVDSCRVWTGFNSASWSRTSKRGYGGAILRRDQVCRAVPTWKPGHYFYELLFWQTLAFMFATVCGGFWKNFLRFSV